MSFFDWEFELPSDDEINKQRALFWLPPLEIEEKKESTKSNVEDLLKHVKQVSIEETKKIFVKEFWIIESKIWPKQLAIYWWKNLFENEEKWAEAYFEWDKEKIFNYLINSKQYWEDLERNLKKFPPISSIVSSKIIEVLEQIPKIFTI
jgi:hypothetical protein